KPRKVNVVPSVAGSAIPFDAVLRKSTKRVLSGWSVSPYRASRLPNTPRTRLASSTSSTAMTASSAKRTREHKGTSACKPWSHLVLEPFVQHVVQEDVRQAR